MASAAAAEAVNTEREIDYSKGKIYILRTNLDMRIYIGSTVKALNERLVGHLRNANSSRNSHVYEVMRKFGPTNYTIELIEDYPCSSKYELEKREFEYISEMHSSLLLNTDTVFGKFSDAHRKKLSGTNNGRFKSGSLQDTPKKNYWIVRWYERHSDGISKRMNKSFGYGPESKSGFKDDKEGAYNAAVRFRESLVFDQPEVETVSG